MLGGSGVRVDVAMVVVLGGGRGHGSGTVGHTANPVDSHDIANNGAANDSVAVVGASQFIGVGYTYLSLLLRLACLLKSSLE